MSMILLFFFFFILGITVGSFLNVVAYRSVHSADFAKRPDLKNRQRSGLWQPGSIFFDSSRCPHCRHRLAVWDLVPIVSFVFLNGKCRYCSKQISLQYPLVEFFTGVLFALCGLAVWDRFGSFDFASGLYLAFLLVSTGTLVVLLMTDLVDGVLPNSVVFFGIFTVLFFKILFIMLGLLPLAELLYSFLSAFVLASIFFIIVSVSSEKAMGGGDIKLVFLIGLFLGWIDFLLSLFVGFLTGALVAVMLILLGKKRFGQSLPLGPFLVFGTFVALFWGKEIIDFYLKMSL
jgi:prepilin signal peptidase PulO-like enzyme (type II secretory pathway)